METLKGLTTQRQAITACLKSNTPALLVGETGTGKTSLARETAAKLDRKLTRVNLDGSITPDMLIGRFQVRSNAGAAETYFQYGAIPQAMREGSVLLLDEINAALPDTLFLLHALLEDSPRLFIPETEEELLPAPGFSVLATMNPTHDYAGTRELNAALYSRFGMVIEFEPLKGKSLLSALDAHVPGLDASHIATVAKLLERASKLRAEEKIASRLSLREGIAALRFIASGFDAETAVNLCIASKLPKYEREHFDFDAPPIINTETVESILSRVTRVEELEAEVMRLNAELSNVQSLRAVLRQFQTEVKQKAGIQATVNP